MSFEIVIVVNGLFIGVNAVLNFIVKYVNIIIFNLVFFLSGVWCKILVNNNDVIIVVIKLEFNFKIRIKMNIKNCIEILWVNNLIILFILFLKKKNSKFVIKIVKVI